MNCLPSDVGIAFRCRRVAAVGSGPGGGVTRAGWALRGDDDGGRCFAPTPLRCSPRGRAAKLAALATRAPLKQSPRVRGTKRASRAAPEAALLGATDIAPQRPPRARHAAPRPAADCRSGNVDGARGADGGVAFQRHDGGCEGAGDGLCEAGRPAQASVRRARLVRSREAQERRPARAARFVHHSRGDCLSGARAASAASFAAGPALRASQGTPAKRGQAPGAPAAPRPALGAPLRTARRPRLCTRQPSARRGPRNAPRSNRGEMSWH